MKIGNDEKIDAITRERMKLAGLAVPGEESPARTEWKKRLIVEERTREMASQLAVERWMEPQAAFDYAEKFVALAFERWEQLQRQEPTGLS